jgi:hypothetical protein
MLILLLLVYRNSESFQEAIQRGTEYWSTSFCNNFDASLVSCSSASFDPVPVTSSSSSNFPKSQEDG